LNCAATCRAYAPTISFAASPLILCLRKYGATAWTADASHAGAVSPSPPPRSTGLIAARNASTSSGFASGGSPPSPPLPSPSPSAPAPPKIEPRRAPPSPSPPLPSPSPSAPAPPKIEPRRAPPSPSPPLPSPSPSAPAPPRIEPPP
jgi:hypothetical protein